MGWMRPTHTGRQSSLLSLSIQILISSRTILTDIHRIMFYQIPGQSMAQSSRHIKLTITDTKFELIYSEEIDNWNSHFSVLKAADFVNVVIKV